MLPPYELQPHTPDDVRNVTFPWEPMYGSDAHVDPDNLNPMEFLEVRHAMTMILDLLETPQTIEQRKKIIQILKKCPPLFVGFMRERAAGREVIIRLRGRMRP